MSFLIIVDNDNYKVYILKFYGRRMVGHRDARLRVNNHPLLTICL